MNRVFFIYLTSIMLLVSAKKLKTASSRSWFKETSILEKTLVSSSKLIRQKFKERTHFDLIMSYVTGNKRGLPTKLKKSHKALNITHLFTPSGLHFSSLYFFFIPLFMYLKKRSAPSFFLTHTAICAVPFLLSGFNSIKRICIFHQLKIIKGFSQNAKIQQIENFYIILLTFIIDALRGSFFESPLSFCYSFIFLSLLFCHEDFKTIRTFFYFLGAQIILTFFSMEHFSLLGLIFGFFLTYIFSYLFPIWLTIFFIPIKLHSIFSTTFFYEGSVDFFVRSILFLTNLTLDFDFYFSSLPLVFTVLICSYKMKKNVKITLITALLLMHSNPLLNFPIASFKKAVHPVDFKSLKKNKIDSIYNNRGKIIILFKNGRRCVHEIRPLGISEKCRFL